jgi:hypothetical protein
MAFVQELKQTRKIEKSFGPPGVSSEQGLQHIELQKQIIKSIAITEKVNLW